MSRVNFPLGSLYITPGAGALLDHEEVLAALTLHASGDWGEVCEQDKQANEEALSTGARLLSAYTCGDVRYWVITEADRSATTLLLPDEY